MPNVIVDTSVIQYLYQVDLFDLLFKIYHQVTIPKGVLDEMRLDSLQGEVLHTFSNKTPLSQVRQIFESL
ncbi:hypothetical protein ACQFX9_29515 [Aliinostoc sp. HNIBRCY26]|uniref:hypothetical protein n=1 Tax=Aliinostoc sp. HNIBRCY26 TaxID=3418997 RepID=UPI003CFFFCF5